MGFLVCFNHPVWSLDYEADYLNYEGLDFAEIFNTGCDRAGLYAYDQMIDVMVKHGKMVGCFAADDNHNGNGFDTPNCDSFGGWIMINAEKLTYESVIDALKNHNFYASCGPEIYSITKEGDKITVKTSPQERFQSRRRVGKAALKLPSPEPPLLRQRLLLRKTKECSESPLRTNTAIRLIQILTPHTTKKIRSSNSLIKKKRRCTRHLRFYFIFRKL